MVTRTSNSAMVAAAWSGAADADVVALLIDAGMRLEGDTRRIIDGLKQNNGRAVCVLNKIDTVPRENLLALIEELRAEDLFTDFFMVSALKGEGVLDLKHFFAGRLPKGPWHFPADQLSDMNDRLFSAEITREKLFLNLHQELPYALTVQIEEFSRNGKLLTIGAIIWVERDSQKQITIGKKGIVLKQIGSNARQVLEELFGEKIFLRLWVKVSRDWSDNVKLIERFGYTD